MVTASKLVTRALRKIGVIDAGESINAVDFETAVEELNAMMIRWEANGLANGWNPVENPSDTIYMPPEAEQAVVYNLAVGVASEWDTEAPASVQMKAAEYLSALRRDRLVEMPLRTNIRAPWGNMGIPSFSRYAIDTGWY